MEDLYRILEVPRDATQADIKKAYRQLVRKYHPDTHPGDREAEEKFKKINAAYSVLGDEEKRARYDQFGTDPAKVSMLMNLRDIGKMLLPFGGRPYFQRGSACKCS